MMPEHTKSTNRPDIWTFIHDYSSLESDALRTSYLMGFSQDEVVGIFEDFLELKYEMAYHMEDKMDLLGYPDGMTESDIEDFFDYVTWQGKDFYEMIFSDPSRAPHERELFKLRSYTSLFTTDYFERFDEEITESESLWA